MEEHPEAKHIVAELTKAGYIAYYAGGWVRDFLLQHPSDDIDIATSAPPEEVQRLFSHTVPIGISFGIILVIIDGREYEVATFRQDLDYIDGRRPTGVQFADPKEDAFRRDFTINGMFYDPNREEVLDYVGGREDLEIGIIRAIGDPHARFKEDRLRMIRAARLSCRFQFPIEEKTKEAILAHAKEVKNAVAVERICQELLKALQFSSLQKMLLLLEELHLLQGIFPQISQGSISIRLKPMEYYPKQAPLVAYLLPLFEEADELSALTLCEELKRPNLEKQWVRFFFYVRGIFEKKAPSRVELAHFYANPFSSEVILILAAHRFDRTSFLKQQEQRKEELRPFIERIERQEPLIKAEDLLALGVEPSKELGTYLKRAEEISINQNLLNKERVLEELGLKK